MNRYSSSTTIAGLIATFLLTLASHAVAQQGILATVYKDHPLLSGFPDSEIIDVEFEQDINYRVVLGSLQRIRGRVEPENSVRLRGDVTRITYEVSQEFSGEDAYQFFLEQMQEKNYSERFSCSGRACGSSNYWANDIFQNRILYGPERNQYYITMQANSGAETEPYMSIYIITRGNRQIYAYLEVVEVGGSIAPLNIIDSDALLLSLQQQGNLILPGISFRGDNQLGADTDLSYLVEMLQNNAELRVYLVAHLSGDEPLANLMRRSTVRANLLARQLIEAGIDADRVIAQGVGPLAPACAAANCGDRVELVLR